MSSPVIRRVRPTSSRGLHITQTVIQDSESQIKEIKHSIEETTHIHDDAMTHLNKIDAYNKETLRMISENDEENAIFLRSLQPNEVARHKNKSSQCL
jgi:hypothetical protein